MCLWYSKVITSNNIQPSIHPCLVSFLSILALYSLFSFTRLLLLWHTAYYISTLLLFTYFLSLYRVIGPVLCMYTNSLIATISILLASYRHFYWTDCLRLFINCRSACKGGLWYLSCLFACLSVCLSVCYHLIVDIVHFYSLSKVRTALFKAFLHF